MILISIGIKEKLISRNQIDNYCWIIKRTMEIILRIHSWQAVLGCLPVLRWRLDSRLNSTGAGDRLVLVPRAAGEPAHQGLARLGTLDGYHGVVGVSHCLLVRCDITVLGSSFNCATVQRLFFYNQELSTRSQGMMHKNVQMVIYKYMAQGVKQQRLCQQNTVCCA